MKVVFFLILTLLFAACGHRATNNQADELQDSATVSQDNSSEINDGHVCMSEDCPMVGNAYMTKQEHVFIPATL